jgi:hypothetical protein
VGKSDPDLEVGPPILETLDGLTFRNVKRVLVETIDPGQPLYQVGGVSFVSCKAGPYRVSVNRYAQDLLSTDYPDSAER